MAAVSPLPFMLAIIIGLGLFAWCTYLLVQDEERHPVRWRSRRRRPTPSMPHLSHPRVAAICLVFALWSLWATTRPVTGWR
jgi:hypothetical protein